MLINSDGAGIGLFDKERQVISVPQIYNLPEFLTRVRLEIDSDIFSLAIRTRRIQQVGDYQTSIHQIKELVDAGIRAIAVVPLAVRGKSIGILWAAMTRLGRTFSDYDLVLLESIGSQAAVAIENINLYDEQKYISETLQRGFLPRQLPELKHTDIDVFYASATEAAVVGGDFYDVSPVSDNKLSLFVGDVSGKGVEATADAAMVKYTLRAVSFENPEPSQVLTEANAIVHNQLTGGHFITLVYCLYDLESGRMLLGVAGHPHPLLYLAASNSISPVIHEEPAFSLIPKYEYNEVELFLNTGDILVLYTDGIIELRRDNEFLGEERLGELIAKYCSLGAHEIADRVMHDAKEFARDRLGDDIALMVIKRTG